MFNFCFIPSPKEKQAHFPNKMPDAERRYRGPTFSGGELYWGRGEVGYLRGGGRGIMGGIVCNKGGKREGRVGKQLKVLFLVLHAYILFFTYIYESQTSENSMCSCYLFC